MADLCNVTIVGRLGSDPFVNDKDTFISGRIARNYRTQQDGEWVEETVWVSFKVLGKNLSWLGQNLRKGLRVAISGELQAERYTRKDGTEVDGVTIVCFGNGGVQILDRLDGGSGGSDMTPRQLKKAEPVQDDLPF